MNACREWNDLLLDAALLGTVSTKLESHLQACSPCTKRLGDLRSRCEQMDHAISGLVGDAEAPRELQQQVLQAVAAISVKRQWWRPEVAAIAAMALVCCVLLLLIPLRRNGAGAADGQRRASISNSSLTWQSPTASLLGPAKNQLLQSPPRLGDFYFPLATTSANALPSQKTHRRKP